MANIKKKWVGKNKLRQLDPRANDINASNSVPWNENPLGNIKTKTEAERYLYISDKGTTHASHLIKFGYTRGKRRIGIPQKLFTKKLASNVTFF